MNLLTFNEKFAVIASREGRDAYEKACVAPLFDYTSIRKHVYQCIDNAIAAEGFMDSDGNIGTPFTMPFPIFRAEFKMKNKPNEKPVIRYDVMVFGNTARVYFRVLHQGMKHKVFCFELLDHGNFEITVWNEKRREFQRILIASIKDIDSEAPGFQLYTQLVGTIVAFTQDANSPTTHCATVSPADSEGRSVQWVKARTHFTFIHHGHPANKATVSAGSRVASDPERELTRMAHSRRAHDKVLKHPRWTYARGKKIRVRACWVGPKEWQDEGGKQIYRILEPSEWQPENGLATTTNLV